MEREIRSWFGRGPRNVGLVTGNGVCVVDVDDRSFIDCVLEQCGDTPMRCQTPNGMHLYYAAPAGVPCGNYVRIHNLPVDVRCDGAYAVCPWSRDACGVPYEWVGDIPAASELPPINTAWLQEATPKRLVTPVVVPNEGGHLVRRARRYLAHVEGAISGRRGHDRTFRVACVLAIKFGLTPEHAWPLFLEWNRQCEPPWSEKELHHKLQDAFKQRFTFEKGEPMSLKVTIHSTGSGTDLLTGKEGKDGLTVTFDDGTVRESFLSWASFRQLLALKNNQAKPEAKPEPKPALPIALPAAGPVAIAK